MFRALITTLATLSLLITQAQVSYMYFPSHETVVKKFYTEYIGIDESKTIDIEFEKRPNGWHVVQIDYNTRQRYKDELFWQNSAKAYRNINFPKAELGTDQSALINLELSQSGNYSCCPYYGYDGWDADVIKDYKDATNLPDSILYGLGRAYSSYASNLLNDNSGFADHNVQFGLTDQQILNTFQLGEYRKYRHLAIEIYKKVDKLNPRFQTIVGPIKTKLDNEYLTSFLELRQFSTEEEATKELIPGLYTEFLIAMAKNYLSSCKQNAILVTNGDNDTYPLLYVQKTMGFRTDVLVANISLLNTSRYINSLRRSYGPLPLQLTLTPADYENTKLEVAILEEGDKPMDLAAAILHVKDPKNTTETASGILYPSIPSQQFTFKAAGKKMDWNVGKPYVIKNGLILMDMIATNKWVRPIYFAYMSDEVMNGLYDHCSNVGLINQIVPEKYNSYDGSAINANVEQLYKNLMSVYDWKGMDKIQQGETFTGMNYRLGFSKLANALIDENKLDSAIKVLDRSVEVIPNEALIYNISSLQIADAYYRAGQMDKANTIARIFLKNLKENKFSNYDKNGATDKELVDLVKALAERYEQQDKIGL